jgi:hypothetical protein
VRALLESGADPTIADDNEETPMDAAKDTFCPFQISPEGHRECVAALEVSCCLGSSSSSTR